ncbi:MAG: hypothetical protein AAGD25_04965 [Cyanobacteria bacterium P01_F01_bin.150]
MGKSALTLRATRRLIWRYENYQLRIDVLQSGQYIKSSSSIAFPTIPVIKGISSFLRRSRTTSRHQVLRGFRQWVRDRHSG